MGRDLGQPEMLLLGLVVGGDVCEEEFEVEVERDFVGNTVVLGRVQDEQFEMGRLTGYHHHDSRIER